MGTITTNNSLISVNLLQSGEYTIREVERQGVKYIVVPVTMMVEGVHHGSRGPLLHTIEDLGHFPAAWNGIPIMMDHPKRDGVNISANDPEVLAKSVGQVFNTHTEDNKLKAEAWFNENSLRNISPETLHDILQHKMLEVSVGVFSDEETVSGNWNGEEYTAIARNHRPDHLAVLPGGTGACSVEDGCGIRNNNKEGGEMGNSINDTVFDALKSAKAGGLDFYNLAENSDPGYLELVNAARQKIDAMDTNDSIHYLQDVFENYIVYEVRQRIGGTRIFKQNYQLNNGNFELTGNPVEVRKSVEYTQVNRIKRNNFNKKEDQMDNNVKCVPCAEKINALIANEATSFTEADREWLSTLEEKQLDKMIPKKIEAPVVNSKKDEPIKLTSEQVLNAMSDEDRAVFEFGRKQLSDKRNGLIRVIQDNTSKEMWPDAVLNSQTNDFLERLAASTKKEESTTDYAIMGGGNFVANATKEEIPGFYSIESLEDEMKGGK